MRFPRSAALLLVFALTVSRFSCQSLKNISFGLPEAWHGDRYGRLVCPSYKIPSYLNGYFLCQLSASYGDQYAPDGQKLTHMLDGIGAVGAFRIFNGEVSFAAQYYPARPYKIWDFYNRNMSKASVAWIGWSKYNQDTASKWHQMPPNPDMLYKHPNVDFWKVGTKVVAATEAPHWVGYEFSARDLDDFKVFGPVSSGTDTLPLSMAVHERYDENGTLWGSFIELNIKRQRFYHSIFTVDKLGDRTVVASFELDPWDASNCDTNHRYKGNKRTLPGYMHSIASTNKYIILPITSLLFNPCKVLHPPALRSDTPIQDGGWWLVDYDESLPMRFLVFNKDDRTWATEQPIEVNSSMFVTHQLNAYERADGTIVADMIAYDNDDPYRKYLRNDFMLKHGYPSTAKILRFTIDLAAEHATYNNMVPEEQISAEFPQINHAFDNRPYRWAYLVEHPYAADNAILKINVDDPTGGKNRRFNAESSLVLHEPWFVQRPNTHREDDGVLLVRALDVSVDRGVLMIVDAATMTEIGRAHVPISVPFGFHNRYYSDRDLGLSDDVNIDRAEELLWREGMAFERMPAESSRSILTVNIWSTSQLLVLAILCKLMLY